jgi:hypothetical protein
MDEQELEEQVPCRACGALVWPNLEPSFVFGEDQLLCLGCSMRRGGEFDAEHERWARDPDVSELTRAESAA